MQLLLFYFFLKKRTLLCWGKRQELKAAEGQCACMLQSCSITGHVLAMAAFHVARMGPG